MRILRNAFLAVGLMAIAGACGGGQKEASEPVPAEPAAETPAEGMGEEGATEGEGMGEEGATGEEGAEGGEGGEGGEW